MAAPGVPWTCPAYLVPVAFQDFQGNFHQELASLDQNGVNENLIQMERIHVHQNVQKEAHLGSYTLILQRLPGLASALAQGRETPTKKRRRGDHERMLLY